MNQPAESEDCPMVERIRSRLTYANIMSTLALFFALTTGTVYAANEWTGANIVDGSLTAADLAVGTIGTLRVQDNSLQAADLAPDSVGSSEIANGAVGTSELKIDAVQAINIADDTIDGGEVVDNSLHDIDLATDSVHAAEIAANAVGASEILTGAVGGAEVANSSLTGSDLAGAQVHGAVSFAAGSVPNGRCGDVDLTVGGAIAGDAVIFSLNAPAPEGVLFYGVRVPANDHVTMKLCNLSGGAMPAINDLPVSVLTITL
jgi:hypothetical protein